MSNPLISNRLTTLSGSGAPSSTPSRVGDIYVDTDTDTVYMATSTGGAYSWAFIAKGQSSAFDKDTVAGLISWYKAEDASPSTEGTNITSWTDSSDTGNTLTVVLGTRAYTSNVQNGQPGIRFASGYIHGADKTDRPQPITTFVVFKPTDWSTGSPQIIFNTAASSTGYCSIGKYTGTTNPYTYAGGILQGSAVTNNTSSMITSVFNSTSSSIQLNDGSPTLGNAGTRPNANYPIIGSDGGGATRYTGYVMEVLVYDGALSSADQDTVRAYLNNKYAIY